MNCVVCVGVGVGVRGVGERMGAPSTLSIFGLCLAWHWGSNTNIVMPHHKAPLYFVYDATKLSIYTISPTKCGLPFWSYTLFIICFVECIIIHLDNTNSLYDTKEHDGRYVFIL